MLIDLVLSGRFDFHVQLPAPAASERGAILKHEIQRRSLQCSDEILVDVASKCEGYDAYDLVFNLLYVFSIYPYFLACESKEIILYSFILVNIF